MQLLILLVVIVGIVALGQLAKVYELSSRLSGRREEDISHADTRLNANLWLVFMVGFFASVVYLYRRYGDYARPRLLTRCAVGLADELQHLDHHGGVLLGEHPPFRALPGSMLTTRTARPPSFPHDNRLELIWTVIPSIVLAVIIIYGLQTWNVMTGDASADALRVELYSKQFDWTARYPGKDGEFGQSNYNLITPMNPMGIITGEGVEDAMADIEKQIAVLGGGPFDGEGVACWQNALV